MSEKFWEGKRYAFFQHRECEFFPCHKIKDEEDFNCLFCYCPLYALGSRCGGNFKVLPDGSKDCSDCVVPHIRDNYGYIIGKYAEIGEVVKANMAPDSKTPDKSGD